MTPTPTSPAMPTAPAAPAAPSAPPTQPCVRCGEPVGLDVALCENCNPLALAQPSASQAHGTIFLGIVGGVIALALLGRFALSEPVSLQGSVAGIVPSGGGLSVTVKVTNAGRLATEVECRIVRPSDRGLGLAAVVHGPEIAPGATLSFSQVVTEFGTAPLAPGALTAACTTR
jgi:uncharacterized membrane protein YeaQ/YmgE (transglycosylase-associated protein family)